MPTIARETPRISRPGPAAGQPHSPSPWAAILDRRTFVTVTSRSEALFLGGRSGVGKSSIGSEMHVQLSAAGIRHCLIEGDNLDMAYPPPWEHGLGARNLAAMWANYRALDYRRMIYTNTVSVRFVDDRHCRGADADRDAHLLARGQLAGLGRQVEGDRQGSI